MTRNTVDFTYNIIRNGSITENRINIDAMCDGTGGRSKETVSRFDDAKDAKAKKKHLCNPPMLSSLSRSLSRAPSPQYAAATAAAAEVP